ncbi:MAG: hypothetical protein WCY97_05490 [Methanothrix sp.]
MYLRAHPPRMFFGWSKGRGDEIKAFVSINYGSDQIRHEAVEVPFGASVLDALKAAANVEVAPDESSTGHSGPMVTAIDGFFNGIDQAWIYYVFERGESGWRIPEEMPDSLRVSNGMRIGWRLYNFKERGAVPKEGPLWSSRCASKTRTCARQFP